MFFRCKNNTFQGTTRFEPKRCSASAGRSSKIGKSRGAIPTTLLSLSAVKIDAPAPEQRPISRLERALHRVELLQREIQDYYQNFKVSNNLLELRNLVQVAELIIRCALERKESRGLHYTLDFPDLDPNSTTTILSPKI